MTVFRTIFLLLMLTATLTASQFCASDGSDPPPDWNPADICTDEAFQQIGTPPIMNASNTGGQYELHNCNIAIMLDLDQTYTSMDNWTNVGLFIRDTVQTCMDRGVGYKTYIYPLFNSSIETICCGEVLCSHQIALMPYDSYVGVYQSLDPIQNETSVANFTYALTDGMKKFADPNTKCLYNNVVLITNRLFNSNVDELSNEIEKITDYGCITFTVIAVGNAAITQDVLENKYKEYTTNLFAVPGFNCLANLKDCIKPCGPSPAEGCLNQELADCPYPTAPPTTTTLPPPSTTTTPIDRSLEEYWHIIYLFALSNRTSNSQFQNAVKFISQPLQDCMKSNTKVVVRFLARNNVDSGWMKQLNHLNTFLETLQSDEVLLDAAHTIDVYDNTTLQLVMKAVNLPVDEDRGVEGPRITLMTDFVSQNLIDAYNNKSDNLMDQLEGFDFEIYAFNPEAAAIYKNQTVIKPQHIHADPDYSAANPIPLCQKKPSSVWTILIIIICTCAGAMILLTFATILYRQKYMWMQKLNRFKDNSNSEEVDIEDIIDYWELPIDKLTIKSERLGHGAYGQVYKGKLIGTSPAVEHYFRKNIQEYTDCEVAVKMLPKFASENARAEFMHEIQLMKTLGYNEYIVNMLGCITNTTTKSCLVLELCSNRDLLRYLKQRKAELEISKSMDEQIECTKEFLNFAWQVAQGMKFLGQKNIIHRDLAARNILISGLDGMKSAKIGDFGLAISSIPTENEVSAKGRLPIKWLALESLKDEVFSVETDIWSFGIVLFEMYSMGEIPFADVEPIQLVRHLEEGNRPKRPLLATDKEAEVMAKCWDKEPKKRPTFSDLSTVFTVLLEQSSEGYGYLALIKTNENYRTLNDVHVDEQPPYEEEDENSNQDEMKGSRPRLPSNKSDRSRVQIDGHNHTFFDFFTRKRAGTQKPSPAVSVHSLEESSVVNKESVFSTVSSLELGDDHIRVHAREIKRRKSNLPFNVFGMLRKATSRRGSVPY